jgi:hypothetical protein
MMDFDELLSDNHSLSINQLNHSSDGIFFAGNYLKPKAPEQYLEY